MVALIRMLLPGLAVHKKRCIGCVGSKRPPQEQGFWDKEQVPAEATLSPFLVNFVRI
jgi:hypothetical protein